MPRVPLFCSYHILTSSVIYYWTEARQHGIYLLNITGDRAKMNKLVQMAWTFSNDRFVCCCCLSLSIVLPLTPFISEYHWWALGITSELSCCWYSSPTRQQVCYVCEDQGHRWLTAYDSPVVLVITATTVTAAGKKKLCNSLSVEYCGKQLTVVHSKRVKRDMCQFS